MAYLIGKDVLIEFYRDTDYLGFLCATDVAINVTTQTKSVKTVGDGQWAKVKPQVLGYDVSLNGIVPIAMEATNVDAWEILNAQIGMTDVTWRVVFRDSASGVIKVVRGEMLPIGTGLSAPIDFVRGSFSFTGNGALLIEDSIPSCVAEILSVSQTNPTFHASPVGRINYYGFSGFGGRIDYTIDGGGTLTVLSPPSSGYFSVNVGNPGIDHDMILTPICANGLPGTDYPYTITAWFP